MRQRPATSPPRGRITTGTFQTRPLLTTKGDKVRDITGAVQSVINAKDGSIFGFTDVYLEGERSFVRSEETNLGNLTADANAYVLWTLLEAAQTASSYR